MIKYDPSGYYKTLGIKIAKGGAGSGNFGHSGRPGEVGGSSSEGGGESAGAKPPAVRGVDVNATDYEGKEITAILTERDQNGRIRSVMTYSGVVSVDRGMREITISDKQDPNRGYRLSYGDWDKLIIAEGRHGTDKLEKYRDQLERAKKGK